MQITEPATLATDYLMGAFALVWYWGLGKGVVGPIVRHWRSAFVFLALASFLGGTYHGFQAVLPPPFSDFLWRAVLATAALTSLFLLLAGAGQFCTAGGTGWHRFAWLKALVVLVASQVWPVFLVVLADTAVSLLAVTIVMARGWDQGGRARTRFLAGVGLFVAGGVVQAAGLAPHPAFNHNDLFHVMQILGNWMFYLCAREALPRKGSDYPATHGATNE